MFSPFLCGCSFRNQEKEDNIIIDTFISSPCSTPKRSRKSGSYYKNKENNNRYSNLGLGKFNALLSELEEKKQKIYTQKGAEDIDLVEFVISSDNEIKPVIVVNKMKGKRRQSDASSKTSHNLLQVSEQLKKHIESSHHEASSSDKKLEVEEIHKKKKKRGCWASSHFKLKKFKQPFYYLPVVVILILLFLAIYGRPFAILCTSIGWYLIPLLRGRDINSSSNDTNNNNNQMKLKRRKEHSRRLLREQRFGRNSNNDESSSPTSVFNGPTGVSPPPTQHDHRRSW